LKIFFVSPRIEKFLNTIENETRQEISREFQLLGFYGNNLRMPFSKAMGDGLFELRIIKDVQIRFIYTFHIGNIYILHGFFKKTYRISQKDINYAKKQKRLLK